MTRQPPSLFADSGRTIAPPSASLQEVLDAIERLRQISKASRANMTSSIRTLCKIADREPRFIAADPESLRRLFDTASPGAIGLTARNWANVKSNVRRAARLVGIAPQPTLQQVPLDEAWRDVVALEAHVSHRSALKRFAHFCCARQLSPQEITDETVEQFRLFLDEQSLSKDPERISRNLIAIWNRTVACDRDIQPLNRRGVDRSYTLAWPDLPPGLRQDAAAYFEATTSPARRRRDMAVRQVRTSSAKQYDRMIRRLATAEIQAGVDPNALNDLADLVRTSNLDRGLQFFEDRQGESDGRQAFDMAVMAKKVARDWAKHDPAQIATIAEWCRALRPSRGGMTTRNRERLRQFANMETFFRLAALPDQLASRAAATPLGFKAAMLMQKALAIAILLAAPIRLNNLRHLDRTAHLRQAMSLSNDAWHIELSAQEVKNDRELRLPLPRPTMDLIDLYMSQYQPCLTKQCPSSLLFPGREGRAKSDGGMRKLISNTIRKELGLHMHPHLFRHLAALFFLKAHPGNYETVRQLLGHRSIQTTIEFYAGCETENAFEQFHDLMFKRRNPHAADRWSEPGRL